MAITTGTGTNAGSVSFGGAIDTDSAGSRTLTIDSGSGSVTFTGAIGLTNALGGLNVNATAGDGAGVITFSEDIGDTSAGVKGVTAVGNSSTAQIVFAEDTYTFDTGATTFTATSGDNFDLTKAATTTFTTVGTDITFTTGAIALANGSNLVIDTGSGIGNITLGEIAGTSVETVTLDAGTGTTSVGVIGNSTEIGALNIGSSDNGAITLNGVITTDGAVTIDGPVTLGADITVTTVNDAITFNHTINGTQSLTLESGTAAITLDGVIGGDAILTGLSVNATDGSTGTIEITDIGDSAGVGVNTGTISIGNANTSSLTLDGTTYKTDGVTIFEAAAGNTILLTGVSPTCLLYTSPSPRDS